MVQEKSYRDSAYQQITAQMDNMNDPEQVKKAYQKAKEITGYQQPEMPDSAKHPIASALIGGALGAGLGAAFGAGSNNPTQAIFGGMASGMAYGFNKAEKAKNKWKAQADETNLKLYTATADAVLKQSVYNSQAMKNLTGTAKDLGSDEFARNVANATGMSALNPERGLYNKDTTEKMMEIAGNNQMGEAGQSITGQYANAINAGYTGEQPQAFSMPNVGKLSLIDQDNALKLYDSFADRYKDGMDIGEKKRHNLVSEADKARGTTSEIGRRNKLNIKTDIEMDKINNPDKYAGVKDVKPEKTANFKKALSQFMAAYNSGNQEKINIGRTKFIEFFGIDPMTKIKTTKSSVSSSDFKSYFSDKKGK